MKKINKTGRHDCDLKLNKTKIDMTSPKGLLWIGVEHEFGLEGWGKGLQVGSIQPSQPENAIQLSQIDKRKISDVCDQEWTEPMHL
jgi:hypothetical protein